MCCEIALIGLRPHTEGNMHQSLCQPLAENSEGLNKELCCRVEHMVSNEAIVETLGVAIGPGTTGKDHQGRSHHIESLFAGKGDDLEMCVEPA